MVLTEAVEHLVRGIVEHPDDVSVRMQRNRRGQIIQVRVHPDDMGRVIGRSGRTATAIRTVLGAIDSGERVRVDFVDVNGR